MKQQLSIKVRGNKHEWSFNFDGDPKYLVEWREDGLVIEEIYNSIPIWLPTYLIGFWCFIQDIFKFRNPFL